MKNFESLLFFTILLTIRSFTMALQFESFQPIKTIGMKGGAAGDYFGFSVSTAGDIDKDGYDDILIAAPRENSGLGAVYVLYGAKTISLSDIDFSNSPLLDPQTTGFMITGSPYLGNSVSSAGDIDKDGYDDIIIGSSSGIAHVIYGGSRLSMSDIDLSILTLSVGFQITGDGNDALGSSVSSAGDVNNDGYDDIIVGAFTKNNNQGIVYVIYGGPRALMTDIALSSTSWALNPHATGFMITGNAVNDYFGYSVSGAGDINQDGYDDIIVGAPQKSGNSGVKQGAAYVIYGGPKTSASDIDLSSSSFVLNPLTTGFKITGNVADDYLGNSVRSAGDMNQDGYDDIIVAAIGKNNAQGVVYVIYGGPKSPMGNIDFSSGATLDPLTTGFMIKGTAAGDNFGNSLSKAGDVNKDGYADIVVGDYGKNNGQGAVYVIYGGPKSSMSNIDLESNPIGPGFFYILETIPAALMGISVGAADINGDGLSDLIIGAFGVNSFGGATYLILNQCPAHCETCSVWSSCEVCIEPYFLQTGQCVLTCPVSHFILNGEECQKCAAGCSECTSLLNCQACLDGYTLAGSLCVKDNNGEKVAAEAFEGTTLAGAALSSGSSLPFNFGLVAKLIRNFKYMKLPVSRELFEAFVSWKVASGFMSAPKSWSGKYSSRNMPEVFSRYALQSAFLINFWKPFVMALIGFAVFGIFKAIEVLLGNDKRSIGAKVSRQINVAASNFALTQFYSNLDDLIFYFVLEMRSTKFETGFRIGSSLLAVVLFLIGGVFVGLHWNFISKYQTIKGSLERQFESKCENISLIFRDFKDTNSLIQSFLMINVVRSVISSLIFATLFEYPMIQISLMFVLNILMIFYLWRKKSFKDFINTCSQIFCEGILFIANICVFLLALFDHADSYPLASIENLGKCIIVLNFILLFGCALFLIFSLLKTLYETFWAKKKAQRQVYPAEDNSILEEAKFKASGPAQAQANHSLSTTYNGMINEYQTNVQNSGSGKNPLETCTYGHENVEKSSSVRYRQGISNNNIEIRARLQNHIESLDMSDSNIVLHSSQIEDFREDRNQTNISSGKRQPRSRLVRNREITQARINQLTMENSKYQSRIQNPSFHSRVISNEEYQDVSLTSFDIGTESPQRVNDFVPQRRRQGN